MDNGDSYRLRWYEWPLMYLGHLILSLFMRLNRLEYSGEEHLTDAVNSGQPVYVGLWHGRLLMVSWAMRKRRPYTLVSQSRDGEFITRILEIWGIRCLRGSSRKGARDAVRGILRNLKPGRILAVTMDGPIGPVRQPKPGSVAVARRMQAHFIPISVSATRLWQLSSWDSFQIPKPFGRILVSYGPPLTYPDDTTDVELADLLAAAVSQLEQDGDARASGAE